MGETLAPNAVPAEPIQAHDCDDQGQVKGLTREELKDERPQDMGGTITQGNAAAFFAGDKV